MACSANSIDDTSSLVTDLMYGNRADIAACMKLFSIGRGRFAEKVGCAVYVISTTPARFVKIGLSVNPKRRLDSLQGANFEKLYISHLFWFSAKDAGKVEKLALDDVRANGNIVLGEWTSLSAQHAARLVSEKADELGVAPLTTSDFLASCHAALVADREYDGVSPSNIYRKSDWSEVRNRANLLV